MCWSASASRRIVPVRRVPWWPPRTRNHTPGRGIGWCSGRRLAVRSGIAPQEQGCEVLGSGKSANQPSRQNSALFRSTRSKCRSAGSMDVGDADVQLPASTSLTAAATRTGHVVVAELQCQVGESRSCRGNPALQGPGGRDHTATLTSSYGSQSAPVPRKSFRRYTQSVQYTVNEEATSTAQGERHPDPLIGEGWPERIEAIELSAQRRCGVHPKRPCQNPGPPNQKAPPCLLGPRRPRRDSPF